MPRIRSEAGERVVPAKVLQKRLQLVRLPGNLQSLVSSYINLVMVFGEAELLLVLFGAKRTIHCLKRRLEMFRREPLAYNRRANSLTGLLVEAMILKKVGLVVQ